MAPSTFASAAAGNNQAPNSAREGASEWSRRPNGATQTFRRPSSISMSNNQPDTSISSQPAPRYVPPHRNGTLSDARYSKDQLLDLYKAQQNSDGGLRDGLSNLYLGGWQPDATNGAANASWGRADHGRDTQLGPEVCWDKDGSVEPLGLTDMDDEERELFFTSVNTPLKPPSTNKDNQQSNGLSGRKVSISNQAHTPGGYGPLSPSASRGQGRRRDTSESFPFPSNSLSSPTATFDRNEQRAASPPPSLQRRRTDLRDNTRPPERETDSDDKSATTPFGTLKRNQTGPLSAGFGAPPSPWSNAPPSAGLSPMGSFGNFGLGQPAAQAEKRSGIGSGRAESRFKNLLNKDSNEDPVTKPVERKASMSSLSRVNENESWRPLQPQDLGHAPPNEADEDHPSGSAALAADTDFSPSNMRQGGLRGFGTPSRSGSRDDYGSGAFGMTTDNAQGFGQGFMQQTPAQQRHTGGNEPMSPTDTNPYQSPQQPGIDHLREDVEGDVPTQLPGLGGLGHDQSQQFGGFGGLGALPNLGRVSGVVGHADDRSQTSSVGANRGFPVLGGLGPLGGASNAPAWPSTQGGLGTPGRSTAGLSSAFGGGIFATSAGDMQSPGLAGLGGGILSPNAGLGGNRMTGMFPPTMQDQVRQGEQDPDVGFERSGQPQYPGLGDFSRAGERPFGEPQSGPNERDMSDQYSGQFGAPGQQSQQPLGQALQQQTPSASTQGQNQQPPSSAANQPPAPQQRTMVMPDRMRWIYRDPQGQMQGPWSGLEMHDWYKAGFFSPELLVKKYEDPDYEPLAQLIRRIGNSREPFLVPQIGIPHGSSTTTGPNAWAGSGPANAAASPAGNTGGAQPPFASSFPSFGTTLTADQQNALERRKQEEQYLMARQKEHLAQQQIAQRMQLQMQPGAPGSSGLMPGSGQLHHHGSAQSLHSQPSFGSLTSPNTAAYQPSPNQGPQGQQPGFFDNSFRTPGQGALGAVGAGVDSLGHIREEEIPGIMDRLNLGSRAGQGQFGAPGQPFAGQQQMQSPPAGDQLEQQVQQMYQDRARLQQEQAMHDAKQRSNDNDQEAMPNDRLMQFQQFQGQGAIGGIDARFQPAIGKPALSDEQSSTVQSSIGSPAAARREHTPELSLTEQVEKAVSVQQSPVQPQPGLPQPFPPAPSQSPLPAPAAQRAGRQSVADQLQTDQRDPSQTPSVDTPSAAVAPWAKEPAEAPKGPSLKEIQEMEAKKAAQVEEMASAARRAAFQREMEAQAQVIAPAPGLPASASWAAAGGSPITPTSANAAAWAKAAQKSAGPATAKSMAQIQKEEEARKRRLAAVAASAQQATAMAGVANTVVGKSYANLAQKISSSPTAPSPTGSAWTTVGAGGKPKTPAAPPAAPPNTRAVSSGIIPTMQPTPTALKKAPTRSSTMAIPGSVNAQEEFRKWAVGELRPDLNKGIPADEFISNLIALPPDPDMLTEAVHGASNTIDSRHFAEEFIRRKHLAAKGLIPPKSTSPHNAAVGGTGGWSEVAKKGPQKEATREETTANGSGNGNFRVVASKKKGSKR
ncbi:kinesin-like protein [Vermiconidia calcicola]|uniref:Kinesin-like protein n=1 Tax=Vermiconidia calcicola TaxID=1690605 RepID=A0ACC3N791_9PEZI|nr:kinesin-like protein [Vermiconidia calcicola]